jgi:hypothetical protein
MSPPEKAAVGGAWIHPSATGRILRTRERWSWCRHAIPLSPLPKRLFSAFEQTAHMGPDQGIFETTSQVLDLRKSGRRPPFRFGNDQIRICVNDQIRVVRDHNDLPSLRGVAKKRHQIRVDRTWVEILLGLVDDQRTLVPLVQRRLACPARGARSLPLRTECRIARCGLSKMTTPRNRSVCCPGH